MLKKQKVLQREPDDSEDIMCPSIIDHYISRPIEIDTTCLAEFVSCYTKTGKKRKGNNKPYVIRYVKYNRHNDIENFCREKLMLYIPYRGNKNTIKEQYLSWTKAYDALKQTIKQNEQKFTFDTPSQWGDIDDAIHALETIEQQLFNIDNLTPAPTCNKNMTTIANEEHEKYDFENDVQHFQHTKNMKTSLHRPYEIVKQPHILENKAI